MPFSGTVPITASVRARLSGVKYLCFLCCRQRRGPSSRLGGEWSQWGSLRLGGGFSRAVKGGPQTLNPPTFPNGVALAGGGRWALQGALIWGLVWAPTKEAVPISGRRIRPGLLAVCPGDPTLRNPMFFVLSCCLSSCLSHTNVSVPSAPALDPAPHLCPACPPALRDHPDLGALPPPHPFSSSSPPALAFIHTFLLSCPSPRAPACSGREGSRTLFPLFKVSRLVSQEGGLSLPSCLPPLPGAMGEGAIPGLSPGLCSGRGQQRLDSGRAPCLAENVSMCARVCM